MPLRNPGAVLLASAVLLFALACSSADAPSSPTASPEGSDQRAEAPAPTLEPQPRMQYPGMSLELATGDFWDFGWKWKEDSCSQGRGCSTSDESGTFRVTLGGSRRIAGIDFFEVSVGGVHLADGGATDLGPSWAYLGVDGPLLLGSDGTASVVLFDARTGEWTGSGFFSRFGGTESHVAASVNVSAEHPLNSWSGFDTGPALSVARSDSKTMCEIIEGRRICPNDQAFSLAENQYYREGAGPLGYTYTFSMSFSGGSFSSSTSSEETVALLASSLQGDSPVVLDTPDPASAAPPGYVELIDDTGTLLIELPSAWSEVLTEPLVGDDGIRWATIVAAPDMASFYGSWNGPGLLIQVGPEGGLVPDVSAWLEDNNADNLADCTLASRDSYDTFEAMTLVECGGQDTALIATAGHIGTRLVAIIFQFREQQDLDHFTRLYQSLTVCEGRGCPLE